MNIGNGFETCDVKPDKSGYGTYNIVVKEFYDSGKIAAKKEYDGVCMNTIYNHRALIRKVIDKMNLPIDVFVKKGVLYLVRTDME